MCTDSSWPLLFVGSSWFVPFPCAFKALACLEQALEANLKRIEDNTAAMAAADDWVLTYPPAGSRHASTAFQNKLTSSAHRFNLMVQVANLL